MEETPSDMLEPQIREEAADSQVVWGIEKSYGSYTEISAFGLLHLGRKRTKMLALVFVLGVTYLLTDLLFTGTTTNKLGSVSVLVATTILLVSIVIRLRRVRG